MGLQQHRLQQRFKGLFVIKNQIPSNSVHLMCIMTNIIRARPRILFLSRRVRGDTSSHSRNNYNRDCNNSIGKKRHHRHHLPFLNRHHLPSHLSMEITSHPNINMGSTNTILVTPTTTTTRTTWTMIIFLLLRHFRERCRIWVEW